MLHQKPLNELCLPQVKTSESCSGCYLMLCVPLGLITKQLAPITGSHQAILLLKGPARIRKEEVWWDVSSHKWKKTGKREPSEAQHINGMQG